MLRTLLTASTLLLPWSIRRKLLERWLGYRLHPTSRVGLSWVFPKHLVLEAHTSIGNLTVCKGLSLLQLGEHATIGNGNWITGFPTGPSRHFAHQPERAPELILGRHTAVTNRHLIDCTSRVTIGAFTTFAGFNSQILTHSIDLEECRQSSAPVTIGDHCFVGTNCVLLGGASLPDRSVLGAKSLLNRAFEQGEYLYGGVPAKPIKAMPAEKMAYFRRETGFVY